MFFCGLFELVLFLRSVFLRVQFWWVSGLGWKFLFWVVFRCFFSIRIQFGFCFIVVYTWYSVILSSFVFCCQAFRCYGFLSVVFERAVFSLCVRDVVLVVKVIGLCCGRCRAGRGSCVSLVLLFLEFWIGGCTVTRRLIFILQLFFKDFSLFILFILIIKYGFFFVKSKLGFISFEQFCSMSVVNLQENLVWLGVLKFFWKKYLWEVQLMLFFWDVGEQFVGIDI